MPIAAATVTLHLLADSSIVKIELSDKQGLFQLAMPPTGTYFVRITSVGFLPFASEPFTATESGTQDMGTIVLQPETVELNAVDITASRPLVDIRPDRTVVRVDQLLSAQGGSAYDVLKQSPGLSMNQDGAVSIKGKQNVLVLIDGRQTFLSGADLSDYLRGLPADQLDEVEIITQPSAKYDAAGTGGVINLKTKRAQQRGIHASISSALRQGKHSNSNNSLDVNWKSGRFAVATSYSYMLNRPLTLLKQRNLFEGTSGAMEALVLQDFKSISTTHAHRVRAGIDYAAAKTTMGLTYTGTFTGYPEETNTSFSDILGTQHTLVATNNSTRDREARNPKQSINLYLSRTFGKQGSSLSVVADYLAYDRSLEYALVNDYADLRDPANDERSLIKQDVPGHIDIYGFKADFALPISTATTLEIGVKSTVVKMDNTSLFQLFDPSTQRFVTDNERSAHYVFDENINAAYLTYQQQFSEAWKLQAGLRLENTRNDGEEMRTADRFSRRYTQLFPTLMLNYQASAEHLLSVAYNRRVNRPMYDYLIPYAYYTDLLFYRVGNPRLQPELADNLEVSHIFADKLSTMMSYSRINDVQSGVFRTEPGRLVLEEGYANIATKTSYAISVDYVEEIAPWYNLSAAVTATHDLFRGTLADEAIDASLTWWTAQLTNQFSFGGSWSAELRANYQSAMQEDAISVLNRMGGLDASIGKRILGNNGSVRILFMDPLNLGRYDYDSQLRNLTSDFKLRWDNRMIGLSMSYRFTSGKGSQARQRTSSMDEEAARLQ